jgi:hypothetical protein
LISADPGWPHCWQAHGLRRIELKQLLHSKWLDSLEM